MVSRWESSRHPGNATPLEKGSTSQRRACVERSMWWWRQCASGEMGDELSEDIGDG